MMTQTPEHDSPLFSLSHAFSVGMIWAQDRNGCIGSGGTLPWHIPEDLRHFKDVTRGYTVLHGRKSYEALPAPFRPLPGRRNLVLTSQTNYRAPGAEIVHSLQQALAGAEGAPLWIVGGGNVYAEALDYADALVVTEVDLSVDGDTYAPAISRQSWRVVQTSPWHSSRRGIRFRVVEYRRR